MTDIKRLSLHGRLRMAEAFPDINASLLAEAADAIEQHDAFRQEVSDAIDSSVLTPETEAHLSRFIIAKPDPLVEVMNEMGFGMSKTASEEFRAALAARGLEIREKQP